jgi:hypothetical protein
MSRAFGSLSAIVVSAGAIILAPSAVAAFAGTQAMAQY